MGLGFRVKGAGYRVHAWALGSGLRVRGTGCMHGPRVHG